MTTTDSHPQGLLIAVEGIDGSGKSSLVREIAQQLQDSGKPALALFFPTKTTESGLALRATFAPGAGRLPAAAELELTFRDMRETLASVILPALRAGTHVVLDRYYFSAATYQSLNGDLEPLEILKRAEETLVMPDLVLWLNIEVEQALERIEKRGDEKMIFEKRETLEKLKGAYDVVIGTHLQQCGLTAVCRVDGSSPGPSDMAAHVVSEFFPTIPQRCWPHAWATDFAPSVRPVAIELLRRGGDLLPEEDEDDVTQIPVFGFCQSRGFTIYGQVAGAALQAGVALAMQAFSDESDLVIAIQPRALIP